MKNPGLLQCQAEISESCNGDSSISSNGQGPRSARKQSSELKNWVRYVLIGAFFLMAMAQTANFLIKYSQLPMSTSITLEKLSAEHTPWITICPSPGVSYVQLENFAKDYDVSDKLRMSLSGISLQQIADLLAALPNVTIEEFLRQVTLPLWEHNVKCNIERKGDFSSDDCSFSQKAAGKDSQELAIGLPVLNLQKPMVHSTDLGEWHTFLAAKTENTFKICSTLQTNFTMVAGSSESLLMQFVLQPSKHYFVESRTFIKDWQQASSNPIPSYEIYLHQPNQKLDMYEFFSMMSKTLELPLGQSVEIRINMEKLKFLESSSFPCKDNAAIGFSDCHTNCFESGSFGSTCRMPGLRTFPDRTPPACNYRNDFVHAFSNNVTTNKFTMAPNRLTSRKLYEECSIKCSKPCTQMQYQSEFLQISQVSDPITNFTAAVFNTRYSRSRVAGFKLLAVSPHVKVIEQQYAYDFHQFLGELGGSWGLFLGLSLVNVLDYLH